MRAPIATLVASACCAFIGGCVTEIIPVKSSGPASRSNAGAPVTPNGPVGSATPGGNTSTTRVAAAIRPLGAIPYDGLTLPIITPDGRFIVSQTGSIPPWESVLAEAGAVPVPGSTLAAFEIAEGALRPIQWPSSTDSPAGVQPVSATDGLLLGRSAGADGGGWVLVERPNADGSRWIGKLSLSSGQVEWLIQGTAVNAQAMLLRDGTLVYIRREKDQASSDLVFVPPAAPAAGLPIETTAASSGMRPSSPSGERVVHHDGWKYCQPLATPDQSMVAVLAIGANDAQLLAYSTSQVDTSGSPALVAKETMGPLGAAGAFQAVTSIEACPPGLDSGLKSTFLLVNADRQRLALWDPIKGSMSLLPASVAAGVRVNSLVASGLVMASPKGMDFWTGTGMPARLIAGSYVPRSFAGPEGTSLVCLSPQSGSSRPMLDVVALQLVAPKP